MTYNVPVVLNRSLVAHGAEIVFSQGQNHKLLKEAITQHKLLGSSGNVAIVVQNTHTSITSNVDLKGDVSIHVEVGVNALGRVDTH